jgi:PleD family two-component response regulator
MSSSRTVAQKMGVRAGARAYLKNAPEEAVESLSLPELVGSHAQKFRHIKRSRIPSAKGKAMKHRILVIDDEQNARDALKTILTEEGYEVGARAACGETR